MKERPNLVINDGYKLFKRDNAARGSVMLYTLWCTNLWNPIKNSIELTQLNEYNEIHESIWLITDRQTNQLFLWKFDSS